MGLKNGAGFCYSLIVSIIPNNMLATIWVVWH